MMRVTKQFEHLKIKLEAIKSATNNFADDNCIGKGGFGEVYKGELANSKGQTMVALKRLNRQFGQGDPEFWKEIIMLSLYKHENILSLLGFCDENGEKILVYEYASKRSLDLYLNNDDLTWIQRLNICIGAARGLAYLHNPGGTQQRVLHRDIKSSNILLDENWNARISDLGLSKFGPANQQFTFLVSNTVGTIGYCDPLYVETGLLTKESDVYSFGVVLFEVLCGRLCIGNNNDKRRPLTGLARQCYEKNKVNEIIHSSIKDEINSNSLEAYTSIAYQCLKRDLEERPLMTEVVRILESALEHQQGDANSRTNYDSNDGYIVVPELISRQPMGVHVSGAIDNQPGRDHATWITQMIKEKQGNMQPVEEINEYQQGNMQPMEEKIQSSREDERDTRMSEKGNVQPTEEKSHPIKVDAHWRARMMEKGAPPCLYYAQHGVCKFGPSCKFGHPMGTLSYSPSASSLADMPVAPYPVSSYTGILTPSPSSSELVGASNMDDLSTSMASASTGSSFSKHMQLGSSNTTHGGEARSTK